MADEASQRTGTDGLSEQIASLEAYAETVRMRVERFRKEEAGAWSDEIERTARIPDVLWQRVRDLDLCGLTVPAWAGGKGLPLSLYFPILEEVSRCHGSIRMMVHAYNSLWRTIGEGRPEQQREWLPRIAKGEALAAFALTEPGNGTGIDLQTTATYDSGKFVLNGVKHLITFADESDVLAVIAKTDSTKGRKGLTAFLVPRERAGMTMTPMAEMMGDKGCTHAVITFENCQVQEDEVLGDVGSGFDIALRGFLDQSRACIATSAVGIATEALDKALSHVRSRVTFGKPLSSRQAVQMRLAEMATATQACRLLCYDAADKFDHGEPITVESSMAKANAITMVQSVTDSALSLFGGIGYAVGSPVERLYRDARSLWFEEGTIEMQNMTIAESLLAQSRRHARTEGASANGSGSGA